jgi:transcriptional regulator with XRE-family HTH domain
MSYGTRLKKAREHAGYTQAELAEKAKVGSQVNISKLERMSASGSEFTVQYAMACGVNPVWLATGEGEMIDGLYIHDQKLQRVMALMEEMPEYAVDQAIKSIASIKELIDHKNNRNTGTED